MAETLGSLCDKLTIIKLKLFHVKDSIKLDDLSKQEHSLIEEIDHYLSDVYSGKIPVDKIQFSANKIYKETGNETRIIDGNVGTVFSELAKVNCELWHEQEKVYEFDKVPIDQKDNVIKRLAVLNLERNQCIDIINSRLYLSLCKN